MNSDGLLSMHCISFTECNESLLVWMVVGLIFVDNVSKGSLYSTLLLPAFIHVSPVGLP